MTPLDRLRLQGGLRADTYDGRMLNRASGATTPIIDFGTLWQPKLGASFQVLPSTQLYASTGRTYQFGAGSAAYSTADLDASRNHGHELGFHTAPREDLWLRAALWRQDASDEVRAKADGSGDSENVGRTRREGLDLEVRWSAHAWAELWAAWSLQTATLVEPGPTQPQLKGNALDHVPDQMVKLGIDSQFTEAFSTSVWVYGQDAYHLTNDNATGRFGGYVLVNADLRYRWGRVTLGLHAKNLFDRYHEYVWHDGAQTLHSPGDGRTFLGTLSYAF